MNGPEHYAEAERLIEQSKEWANADFGWKGQLSSAEREQYRANDLAEAAVHAQLADAAATVAAFIHPYEPVAEKWTVATETPEGRKS